MKGLSVCWLCTMNVRRLVLVHPDAGPGDCVVCAEALDELDLERCEKGSVSFDAPDGVTG